MVGVILDLKGLSQESLTIIIVTRPQSLYFPAVLGPHCGVRAVYSGARRSPVAFSLCYVSSVAPCTWDAGPLIRGQSCIPALKVVFSATGPPGKALA